MKRLLAAIIIILSLVLFTVPLAFAEGESQSTAIEPNILSDLEYYMDLQNPKATCKTETYLAVANDTEIFVKPTNENGKYIKNQIPTGNKISNICIIDNTLFVLYGADGISNIMAINITDYSPISTEGLNFNSPATITTNGKNLFAVTTTEINSYTITDGKIAKQSTFNLSIGNFSREKIKFINGKGYLYATTFIYPLNFNAETNTYSHSATDKIDLKTDKATDFVYADETLIYCSGSSLIIGENSYSFNDILLNSLAFDQKTQNIIATASNNRVYLINLQGEVTNYYANKGAEISRLNTPSDICIYGKEIYIADTENSRIISQNIETFAKVEYKTTYKPEKVAKTATGLYYLANNIVYDKNSKPIIQDNTAVDIEAYKNNLLILTTSALLIVNGNEISTLSVGSFDTIKTPANTNNTYLINSASGQIVKYNLETNEPVFNTQLLQNEIGNNYNIDFRGNLFVQKSNIITKYSQSSNSFSKEKAFEIKEFDGEIATTIDCINGGYYIANKTKNLLSAIPAKKLEITCTSNLNFNHPQDFNIIKAGVVATDTVALATPDNLESSRIVNAGETFLILAQIENYYYVANNNNEVCEYIQCDKFNDLCDNVEMNNTDMSAIVDKVNVYKLPYKYAAKLTDEQGNEVTLSPTQKVYAVEKVAKDNIWNWYKIKSVDGTIEGYVKADYIAEITPTTPPQNIIFMKTKAKKIGENICIYEKADENSAVLYNNVKDGIDIQIIGEFNENATFTKVYYEDKVGFILTINLQKNGLTPNQIIAISISCVAAVAFTLIIFLFIHKNKRTRKNVSKMTPDILE